MTLKIHLADRNGELISTHNIPTEIEEGSGQIGGDEHQHVLEVDTVASSHGLFKAVSRTTAGTTTITAPNNNGAVVLTDLILTTDKTALSSVTVRFTDDTNTIDIISADSANAPIVIAIPFAGRWRGWKDARLEIVTVASVTATVACGYYKITKGLNFTDWDARR